jgi:thioesterase domain-containing protein
VARIKKITGKDLHLTTLFQARTIEQQATILQEGSMSLLLPLQPNGLKLPFFCVPGVGDNAFIFTGLAHHLGPEQPFYAFRFPEWAGEQSHGVKIKKMAAQYIQEMRQLQPDGPYLLGGYCFGGKVAFEMAQQLYAQGHKVGFVGLFESYLPVSSYIADFEQRVRYHLDNFLKLSLQGKVRLALELGRRRFLKISGKLSPNLARPMSQALGEINYIPQSYPGRLTLFHAIERDPNLYYEPEMGWGGLAAGGIETHAIPGTHINAYKEPHVQIWAEQIRESLDRAQAAG